MIKPSRFYLVCADRELEILCHLDRALHEAAYTVTELSPDGWETYQWNRWKARDALPYVEAAHQALTVCRASTGQP